ncbi:hypothetical protein GLYMA_04G026600v4 [Glycine max]|uniref:Uncharacterized protein n=2 Tax=Glycine subgen. Soja TaxID=1462606 RepID=A0A0R0K2T0_SOYBN|nr:hypothetical protein JHK86_008884 [Glycine max]KRH61072.1 hypothetical protein GLYMA_04G026600v4 [Glycine max]RZC14705.1 hypothetical protein D0Y65_008581 [Glycine soja]
MRQCFQVRKNYTSLSRPLSTCFNGWVNGCIILYMTVSRCESKTTFASYECFKKSNV